MATGVPGRRSRWTVRPSPLAFIEPRRGGTAVDRRQRRHVAGDGTAHVGSADDQRNGDRVTSRKWSSLVGAAVGVLGLGFVGRVMWRQRDVVAETLARAEPAWLVAAVLVGVLGLSVIGWAWTSFVRALGSHIRLVPALHAYYLGQLGKYVPGGVWAVVGRGEWARRAGVPGAVAYSSTMLSMGTAYVAASVVAGSTLLVTGRIDTVGWVGLGVVALGPLGILALHPRVVAAAAELVRRLGGREIRLDVPAWGESVGIVAWQTTAWIGIGTGTWLTGTGLGMDLPWTSLLVATCVSWTAGFLFLPAPGGIGIREAAFVAVLGGTPESAALALSARLVFVVADVVGAGATTVVATSSTDAPTDERPDRRTPPDAPSADPGHRRAP